MTTTGKDFSVEILPQAIQDLIFRHSEPSVINFQMLDTTIRENGFKGEAGRLEQQDPIDYESIKTLRLEYKNILKIDHLWILSNLTKLSLAFNKLDQIENLGMLVHLKDLNLSFNYIEKIENLENLRNLEILSLYNNFISELENLDSLEKLVILSVGNNHIKDVKGISRFRFMKKLSSLNLEGNPIAKNKEKSLRLYVATVLPQLKYYAYSYIKNEERDCGKDFFALELRRIQEAELEEIESREKHSKITEHEERFGLSFVEHLHDDQFYETLFIEYPDVRTFNKANEILEKLFHEFRKIFNNKTQQLFEFGVEKFQERTKEIQIFNECVEEGRIKAQNNGRRIVNELLEYRENAFHQLRPLLKKVKHNEIYGNTDHEDDREQLEISKCIEEFERRNSEFTRKVKQTSESLIQIEIQLHEAIEDVIIAIDAELKEMIENFIKTSQTYFAQLRDLILKFSIDLAESLLNFKPCEFNVDAEEHEIPLALISILGNKNEILKLVDALKESQMKVIDTREGKLIARANAWVAELSENFLSKELIRNRKKHAEIHYFLNDMRDSIQKLNMEVVEKLRDDKK